MKTSNRNTRKEMARLIEKLLADPEECFPSEEKDTLLTEEEKNEDDRFLTRNNANQMTVEKNL